ncbi:MAG: helix-turn-helix domain-containing protein, partial [Verrucomicrobiota bacterium]
LFKQIFECTPADFVEELRLSEARRRLLGVRTSVESVAESVGFNSSDAFRRAFERRVGVTPTAFRRRAHSPESVQGVRELRHEQVLHKAHQRPASIAA